MRYTSKRMGRSREDVPVVPGALLYCQWYLPKARESDPTAKESAKSPNKIRVWWRRVRGTIPQVPEGTAHYKCAPLPIRVNPPLSRSRCGCKASVKLESPLGVEPSYLPLRRKRLAVCLRGLWLQHDNGLMNVIPSQHLFYVQ